MWADDSEPVAWEILAKERIAKYKKVGLVLRGMRYREHMSQKELAKKSGVNQTELSKIALGFCNAYSENTTIFGFVHIRLSIFSEPIN
jgi:DNA-binding XRE family transcriptional regulator